MQRHRLLAGLLTSLLLLGPGHKGLSAGSADDIAKLRAPARRKLHPASAAGRNGRRLHSESQAGRLVAGCRLCEQRAGFLADPASPDPAAWRWRRPTASPAIRWPATPSCVRRSSRALPTGRRTTTSTRTGGISNRRPAGHGADSDPDGRDGPAGAERTDDPASPRPQQDGHDRPEQGLAGGDRVHEGAADRTIRTSWPRPETRSSASCASRRRKESSRTTPSISTGRSSNGATTAGRSAAT